jgi:hypothetical protein
MEYSQALYYNYETGDIVDRDYTPVKLPRHETLHGGQSGFDRPAYNGMNEEPTQESNQKIYKEYRNEKYKGIQFKDTLTVAAFQSFKAEWSAYVLSTRISKQQQTKELLSRGISGKAKVLVTKKFQDQVADTEAAEILKFLEDKVGAHLGVLGKMELVKKIKQDLKEESLINLFLELDTAFETTPNKSDERKIEAAFEAFRSPTLKMSLAKKEEKWRGNWIVFQEKANKIWGDMGGKDAGGEEITNIKQQLNFIQNQAEQRDRAILDRLDHQQQRTEEQINAITQKAKPARQQQPNHQPQRFFDTKVCFTCGKEGHISRFCHQKTKPNFANRPIKKACEYHGSNAGHTSAECIVLQRIRQRQERESRGDRQDQVVATNNNVYSKYNVVINSPATESKFKITPNSNLLQSNSSKSSQKVNIVESDMVESIVIDEPKSNTQDIVEVKESPRLVVKRSKNIKTISSSLYLAAA